MIGRNIRQIRQICQILLIKLNFGKTQLCFLYIPLGFRSLQLNNVVQMIECLYCGSVHTCGAKANPVPVKFMFISSGVKQLSILSSFQGSKCIIGSYKREILQNGSRHQPYYLQLQGSVSIVCCILAGNKQFQTVWLLLQNKKASFF